MSEIEVFEVQCGECGSDFQIDSTHAGTTVHCPHCDSPSEIPSLAEIKGEDESAAAEVMPKSRPVATRHPSAGAAKTGGPKQQPPQKKKQRSTERAASGTKDPAAKEARGKVKATTARSSAKLLLKLSGILYYVACFVGIAWSVKFVGMLYPIVNSKQGSYLNWFIEATITTGWAAALIGLLIAVAELIIVIIHMQENMLTTED